MPLPDLLDPPVRSTMVTPDIGDGACTHGFALLDPGHNGIEATPWAPTRPNAPIQAETINAAPAVQRFRLPAVQAPSSSTVRATTRASS